MKKKPKPNLTLSKETIVNLANGLENVRGGDVRPLRTGPTPPGEVQKSFLCGSVGIRKNPYI